MMWVQYLVVGGEQGEDDSLRNSSGFLKLSTSYFSPFTHTAGSNSPESKYTLHHKSDMSISLSKDLLSVLN